MLKCKICGADGKYKCPRCATLYCSVACCRIHKDSCSPPVESPTLEQRVLHSKELEQILKDDKSLQITIQQTLTAQDVFGAIQDCLNDNPQLYEALVRLL